ncbi:Ribosomal protein S3, C-terminal domain [Parelaphostrongylus tenuis]|uniref:Ribosomal protein S3, C-terminal domain n=1 Tax=Parelaphostrongylus tenuis TaxID=148309 RepID=A0AAD5WGZ4_PARTN|nr:Ribosomal protein S3, C-terminal domain [Parelaphostrongylus tenuis]
MLFILPDKPETSLTTIYRPGGTDGLNLPRDGYSGVEVRRTPARAEVIIMATRTQSVLGERGRRIKETNFCVRNVSVSRRDPWSSTLRRCQSWALRCCSV